MFMGIPLYSITTISEPPRTKISALVSKLDLDGNAFRGHSDNGNRSMKSLLS
jgi:hypothetical protein